jgi:hypothetical protein
MNLIISSSNPLLSVAVVKTLKPTSVRIIDNLCDGNDGYIESNRQRESWVVDYKQSTFQRMENAIGMTCKRSGLVELWELKAKNFEDDSVLFLDGSNEIALLSKNFPYYYLDYKKDTLFPNDWIGMGTSYFNLESLTIKELNFFTPIKEKESGVEIDGCFFDRFNVKFDKLNCVKYFSEVNEVEIYKAVIAFEKFKYKGILGFVFPNNSFDEIRKVENRPKHCFGKGVSNIEMRLKDLILDK